MHISYANRRTSDGVITLVPNPSNRFTGRTQVITELKRHFFNTNDSAQGGAAKKKSDMGSKFFLRTEVGLTNYRVKISPYMVISRDPLAQLLQSAIF